jgi:UDP-glucose 4-epimerase
MSKKILITGGNSFIARSIIDRIGDHKKYSFVCLPRQKLDLLDTQSVSQCLKEGHFDVVVHTATYDAAPEFSTKDPKLVLEKNLKMFFNISRCSEYFGKMLYFGSGAEFGRENWISKMTEEYYHQNIPTDQYGLSKYIMTQHALHSQNIYNLRLFGLFGELDDWRYRFIPNICCKAVLGYPIVIKQNARFDYLFIDDLIKIIEWFVFNRPAQKVYNVCSGAVYDYTFLAEKVRNIASKNLDIIVQEDGLRHEYSGNNMRLKEEIKNLSFTGINTAIERMYNWYNNNTALIEEKSFVY